MKRTLVVTLLAVALGVAALPAQNPRAGEDAMAKLLFDPQLVLRFAKEISLQPAQRTALVNAMKEAQGDMLDLQLQMAERHEELLKAMEALRVDETAALALVDKVLELEREMKKEQLQLLIRTKNALTREQQDRLRELKKEMDKADELSRTSGRSPGSG
jgi:Spy/CpxP family protein refolding chaperone